MWDEKMRTVKIGRPPMINSVYFECLLKEKLLKPPELFFCTNLNVSESIKICHSEYKTNFLLQLIKKFVRIVKAFS